MQLAYADKVNKAVINKSTPVKPITTENLPKPITTENLTQSKSSIVDMTNTEIRLASKKLKDIFKKTISSLSSKSNSLESSDNITKEDSVPTSASTDTSTIIAVRKSEQVEKIKALNDLPLAIDKEGDVSIQDFTDNYLGLTNQSRVTSALYIRDKIYKPCLSFTIPVNNAIVPYFDSKKLPDLTGNMLTIYNKEAHYLVGEITSLDKEWVNFIPLCRKSNERMNILSDYYKNTALYDNAYSENNFHKVKPGLYVQRHPEGSVFITYPEN
jgi:hypothetical protein